MARERLRYLEALVNRFNACLFCSFVCLFVSLFGNAVLFTAMLGLV